MVTATKAKVELVWEPINKPQDEFVASQASRSLFSGAFGAGKTLALCAKSLKLSLDHKGNFGYICRKVRATIGLSTLKTFLELVCPKELIASYNKSDGLITLTNGSQILFGGLDDPLKLGSLGAGGIGFVGIDEAIETTEDDWQMLEGRLRLPGFPHQIFAATNPGPPTHYLYRMFFREHKGDVFQASSYDNPLLPEDYKQRLAEFEGVYKDRYVLGLWKGLEGLVYSAFDDKICLIPRFDVDKSWPIYSGHDFGRVNAAGLFFAGSPATGDFFGFQEYWPGSEMSIHDHVQAFKTITEGRNVLKRVGGNHQETGERQAYTSEGWPVSEPKHSLDKALQIKLVQGMHRLNKVYIFNDLSNYVREKFSFVFKGEKIDQEAKFHLMACLIAGTKIKTITGDKPIEVIKVGDMVATRQGYQPVIASGLTQENAEVFEASFSDDSKLVGTAHHPVFVKDKGFIPLTCLRYNDTMEVWKEKQLSTMGLSITDTRKQNGALTGCISGQQRDFSTVLCGKMPMGRYQQDILSTIRTMTHLITNSLTLNVRAMAYICQGIWRGISMTLNTLLGLNPSALLAFSNGRGQMKGEPISPGEYGGIGNQFSKSVSVADRNTQPLSRLIVSSVREGVKQQTAMRCLGVSPRGKASVYNLSVGNVPEFYANDILVHNCERSILSDFTPETVVDNPGYRTTTPRRVLVRR